jgi:polar amino acid transport system substrate-binding protein
MPAPYATKSSQVIALFSGVLLSLAAAVTAHAECSRAINVPVSPTGLSVIITGEKIHGIFPDLLRRIGGKNACNFAFTNVPKARLAAMFEAGSSDMMVASIKTPRRDEFGIFFPMVSIRATLISVATSRPTIHNFKELIKQSDLQLILVRGFDYGNEYQRLIVELNKQGRVSFESEPLSVARLLKLRPGSATIMAPSIFTGELQGDARVQGLQEKLRLEPLEELAWSYSGTYLSKTALTQSDREKLGKMLEHAGQSGEAWHAYQKVYSPEVVKISIRPLSAQQ